MKIKLANLMLKLISKWCTRSRGLVIQKYSRLSGEIIYKLEWHDYNEEEKQKKIRYNIKHKDDDNTQD